MREENRPLGANADDHPATGTKSTTPETAPPLLGVHRFVRRLLRFDSLPPHLDRTKHWTETLPLTPPDKSSGNFRPKEGDVAYEIDISMLLAVAKPTDESIDVCLERCFGDGSLVAESNDAVVGYFVVRDLSDGQQLTYMNGVDHPPVVTKTIRLKMGIN